VVRLCSVGLLRARCCARVAVGTDLEALECGVVEETDVVRHGADQHCRAASLALMQIHF
jgi:hypothetical protein